MKKLQYIFEQGEHKWGVIARDPEKPDYIIDTNEYIVTSHGHAMLADPGGMEIFPAVLAAISEVFDPRKIKYIFASHQDPDIISSLGLWLEFNGKLKCFMSWLWGGFVPHFGGNDKTFELLPDEGKSISLGRTTIRFVPAHYLHSAGNFHFYDEKAKLYFSGDVGAALLPSEEGGLFVKDFDKHIKYAEKFHQRWMGSNTAKQDWCERASRLDIDMLCPQHGAIYEGKDVQRFIDWFSNLKVGLY